eukprot:scaffold879_cov410-Prasinococcus_capsulatus_cf.AAC.37
MSPTSAAAAGSLVGSTRTDDDAHMDAGPRAATVSSGGTQVRGGKGPRGARASASRCASRSAGWLAGWLDGEGARRGHAAGGQGKARRGQARAAEARPSPGRSSAARPVTDLRVLPVALSAERREGK